MVRIRPSQITYDLRVLALKRTVPFSETKRCSTALHIPHLYKLYFLRIK